MVPFDAQSIPAVMAAAMTLVGWHFGALWRKGEKAIARRTGA